MEDGTSRAHFVDYMKEFIDGDHINVVDCGWNNSSQQNIQNIMKIKTRGYYIGTFSKENLGFPCKREGLIYDIESNGDISDYYWLLRTNFTLIEQLCGAPEGSVCDIKNKKPIQHWQQQEKYIYKKWIAGLQENIADEFLQLCAWLKNNENAIDYELLAKINVKSGLFADERRLQFLNELSENYFDNFSFGKNTTGNISFRKAKPSLRDRLIYPEKRLSILVKKQRGIKTKFGMFFYKIWANLFYFKLTLLGKFNKKKQNNHCKNTKKA